MAVTVARNGSLSVIAGAATLGLAVVLVGCGGASGGSATPTAGPASASSPSSGEPAATGPSTVSTSPTSAVSASPSTEALAFDPASCPTQAYEDLLGCYLQAATATLDSVWQEAFSATGQDYTGPQVEVFDTTVDTACGAASADDGPFYCPGDTTIYLQQGFLVTAGEQAGAAGPYSGVIVLAHEWGHHIQALLGMGDPDLAAQESQAAAENAASVRYELQADCYAGWWSGTADAAGRFPIQESDLQDALLTAAEVGDDFQAEAQGLQADPDTFDHGTSDQRTAWLATGFEAGEAGEPPFDVCDTFTNTRP